MKKFRGVCFTPSQKMMFAGICIWTYVIIIQYAYANT